MKTYDCVIIGGGIGGLMAGIYLARYHCSVIVFDTKQSRARLITKTHNFPAFPKGISGNEILKRLREQYNKYEQKLCYEAVIKLKKQKKTKLFIVESRKRRVTAQTVILATGVIDIEPNVANLRSAIKRRLIRHCLVCDAHEASNKKIAILSDDKKGLKAAVALSEYSKNITVINIGNTLQLSYADKKVIRKKKIILIEPELFHARISNGLNELTINRKKIYFDVVYSQLGVKKRTDLALRLGAKQVKEGCIVVNRCKQTSIKNLYAIGDITPGLNQMCVACSDAAMAATTIFNQLKGCDSY